MGKAGDDWAAGAQAALLELTRQHTTWGSTAYEVTKTFTENKALEQFNLGTTDELNRNGLAEFNQFLFATLTNERKDFLAKMVEAYKEDKK